MARNLVILTGAGISAESGIQTFRGADGLWEGHPVMEVASPEGFAANPGLVRRFYNERRAKLAEVAPNAAHQALAELEQRWKGDFLLVTQNVDDLHERAGSRQLIHMHGELLRALCCHCDHRWPWLGEMDAKSGCPNCRREGGVRPDIVWFGEIPYHMDIIEQALTEANIFIAIGTSGQVYPAAGFVAYAASRAARTIEVNLAPTQSNSQFSEYRQGPATETVPRLVAELLANA